MNYICQRKAASSAIKVGTRKGFFFSGASYFDWKIQHKDGKSHESLLHKEELINYAWIYSKEKLKLRTDSINKVIIFWSELIPPKGLFLVHLWGFNLKKVHKFKQVGPQLNTVYLASKREKQTAKASYRAMHLLLVSDVRLA